jgi:hypothetical protein
MAIRCQYLVLISICIDLLGLKFYLLQSDYFLGPIGTTPEQGPLLEYTPTIKYAESWLFLYNIKNEAYIFPYNASEYAL